MNNLQKKFSSHARRAFPFQLRRILERECDVIYECKVCRNIFRDVANLMTHKRLYCKTAFNFSRDFHFPDNGFIVSARGFISPSETFT